MKRRELGARTLRRFARLYGKQWQPSPAERDALRDRAHGNGTSVASEQDLAWMAALLLTEDIADIGALGSHERFRAAGKRVREDLLGVTRRQADQAKHPGCYELPQPEAADAELLEGERWWALSDLTCDVSDVVLRRPSAWPMMHALMGRTIEAEGPLIPRHRMMLSRVRQACAKDLAALKARWREID